MGVISSLSPAPIWGYFEEICKIPRISRHEEKIRKYLLRFASENNLEAKEDSAGNILIIKPPSPGMEDRKTIVLQSHMDMVGEKESGLQHNWLTDPVTPYIDGKWVTAKGTTLGADDGIGIATQMAILVSEEIKTGKTECLFTVDEESGMTGAINLEPGFFEGRTLINLDSEDEGILFIGCAGGIDTVGIIRYDSIPSLNNAGALEISITGLHGGHSGDEIHKGFANSVKLMTRLLLSLAKNFKISIHSFNGGNLRNAIPREASVVLNVNTAKTEKVKKWVEDFSRKISKEFEETEKELSISVKDSVRPVNTMSETDQEKLLRALNCCPHGVLSWSKDMDDLVETSTNLASISFDDNNTITIVTTQRSSSESSKHNAAAIVESCLKLAGATVTHSAGYPGWKPSLNSEILRITRQSYSDLFGKEPEVRAIHAGLECGLIYEKFKGIDMISFGPTIRGAHTPEEKIEISTVQMFWDLLVNVLINIPGR